MARCSACLIFAPTCRRLIAMFPRWLIGLFAVSRPAYLRLGVAEEPRDAAVSTYSPWRKLQDGPGWLIVVTGPLVGSIWGAVRELDGPTASLAMAA